MKKLSLFVFFLISLLLFSACSSGSADEITVAKAGYTCNAFVKYGENFSSNATVKVIGGGLFSVIIKTPEDIAGLTFSFDNNEMKVSYNGIEDAGKFPSEYGGFSEILNEIFLKFTTSSPSIPRENGEYLLKGNNSKHSFKVKFNEEGFPIFLEVDEEKLSATFSNWAY